MLYFDVVTIFPEMFEAVTRHGITRRALEEGGFDFRAWNPRDFVSDPHRTVDDRPYGGGPGMVMIPGPLESCIDAAVARQQAAGVARPQVVLLSPQGERDEVPLCILERAARADHFGHSHDIAQPEWL